MRSKKQDVIATLHCLAQYLRSISIVGNNLTNSRQCVILIGLMLGLTLATEIYPMYFGIPLLTLTFRHVPYLLCSGEGSVTFSKEALETDR